MPQPSTSPKKLTCPTCFLTDADDRANCINKQNNMCPKPEVLIDDRMIEVRCAAPCGGPHGKHLACPLGNVMKRRQLTNLGTCAFDVCRARVVHPTKAVSVPAPIAEAAGGKGK